jgi:FkbM family methyltransferase
MSLKFVATAGLSGRPIWFCVDDDKLDLYTRRVHQGNFTFPESCIFIFRYFEVLAARESALFVDIGANIGLYTMNIADLGVKTVAIEAFGPNYLLLTAALAKNWFASPVWPIHAAASDSFGLLRLEGDSAWAHVSATGGVSVPAAPAGEILKVIGLARPNLIKIDVEGFEHAVLQGLGEVIADCGPDIVVEVFPRQMKSLEHLQSLGYRPYLISAGRLIRTSWDRFNPMMVADYFCTRGEIGAVLAGHRVCDYTPENLVELVRRESREGNPLHRASIAARLPTAPPEVRGHEVVTALLAQLREDPDPEVAAAAAWSKA